MELTPQTPKQTFTSSSKRKYTNVVSTDNVIKKTRRDLSQWEVLHACLVAHKHILAFPGEAKKAVRTLSNMDLNAPLTEFRCPYCLETDVTPGNIRYLECPCLNVDLICSECVPALKNTGKRKNGIKCLNRNAARIRAFPWSRKTQRVSLLHVFVALKNCFLVRFLLSKGLDVNEQTYPYKRTPISIAMHVDRCGPGRCSTVDVLLQASAIDLNQISRVRGVVERPIGKALTQKNVLLVRKIMRHKHVVLHREDIPGILDLLNSSLREDVYPRLRGHPSLCMAALDTLLQRRQWEQIKIMLEHTGFEPDDCDGNQSLMHKLAVMVDDEDAFRLCMYLFSMYGKEIACCVTKKCLYSPFKLGWKAKNFRFVLLCMQNGVKPLSYDLYRWVSRGYTHLLRTCEDLDAFFSESGYDSKEIKNSLLAQACQECNHLAVVRLLIELKGEVNKKYAPKQTTLLHMACASNGTDRESITEYLVQRGAKLYARAWYPVRGYSTQANYTPLMLSLDEAYGGGGRNNNLVQCLIRSKSNVHLTYSEKTIQQDVHKAGNCLTLAARARNFKMTQLLLGCGVSVRASDFSNVRTGESVQSYPLMVACNQCDLPITRLLLLAKSDVNYSRVGERTPLDLYEEKTPLGLSITNNEPDIVRLLLQNKAHTQHVFGECGTALQHARSLYNLDIVHIIESHLAEHPPTTDAL